MSTYRLSLVLVLGMACRGESGAKPSAQAPAASPAPEPVPSPAAAAPAARIGLSGNHRDQGTGKEAWIPAEFKRGMERWKDTGVYVDGKPIGFLRFGELPVALQPVWIEDEVSAPMKRGEKNKAFRVAKQRHYRFAEYLQALGVDLRAVREVHVMGPRFSETIVVTGEELKRHRKDFLFRFGGDTSGKAIPVVPRDLTTRTPDKITGVMVYVDKKPPTLVRNKGLELDGKIVTDVPYYGEPLRGGVRVYLDDRLALVIKRRLLESAPSPITDADGNVRWRLLDFLEAQGVDTKKISEAWIVRGSRRVQKLSRAELLDATFEATPQASGQILVGRDRLPANALAFHSKPVRPSQLPHFLPHETPR